MPLQKKRLGSHKRQLVDGYNFKKLNSTPGTRFPRAIREPSRRKPAGSPFDALFPPGVSFLTFQSTLFKIMVILHFFTFMDETLKIEEICDTPAEVLASRDTTCACFDAAWQTVGGKGADFLNQKNFLIKKTADKLNKFVCSLTLGYSQAILIALSMLCIIIIVNTVHGAFVHHFIVIMIIWIRVTRLFNYRIQL